MKLIIFNFLIAFCLLTKLMDDIKYGIFEGHFQHPFSVNLYLGVLDDHVIGLYFVP